MIFKAIRMTLSQIWQCLYENRVVIGLCIVGVGSAVGLFCFLLWLSLDPALCFICCLFYLMLTTAFVSQVHTNYEKLKEKGYD